MKTVDVTWRGTWGVGDFMMALNVCHLHAWKTNCKINLEMHWEHGEDHLHHFEEEETIIERMTRIHNFYHDKDRVTVTHLFNQTSGRYYYTDWQKRHKKNKNRFTFSDNSWSDKPGSALADNRWMFREDCLDHPMYDRKKVVIWRPLYNAEEPRTWKRLLTNDAWESIILRLSEAGMNITELTYRTPVSEAMFHIATCRQIVCYDGMWHYIGRNFMKPMIVVSEEGITTYHTPDAIKLSHNPKKKNSIKQFWHDLSGLLGRSKRKSREQREFNRKYYGVHEVSDK
jgi:hypothetical protein